MRYVSTQNATKLFIRISLIMVTTVFRLLDVSTNVSSIYCLVVCCSLIALAYLDKKKFLSEYMIILLFILLFHFGQVIIYVIEPNRYLPVFSDFNPVSVKKAIGYSLLSVQMFDLVYSFVSLKVEQEATYSDCLSDYLRWANIISKIGLIVLTPIIMIKTATMTLFSLRYGYMSLYAYDGAGYNEGAIMPYLRSLFVILCILYICSVSFNSKKSRIPLILLIVYSVLMFLSGSRSGMLCVLLPMLLMYTTKIKKIQKEHIGRLILIAIILIGGSVFMSYFRLMTSKTSSDLSEAIDYVIKYNPINTMMIEMGGTLKPVIYCVEIFSEAEPLKYGISYIASIFLLVPNIGHFLGSVHPAAAYSNLSQWLMDYKNLNHGPGFSIIAESYYNFGSFGFIAVAFWAIIICKLLGNPSVQNEERNFITYASMTLLFSLIRGSTSDFLRYFVFEVLILNLIIKLLAGTFKNKTYKGENLL